MASDLPGETKTRAKRNAPMSGADEARGFARPALAKKESRVARSPVDTSTIPGWGVDADDDNDPTWPLRDRTFDDSPGRNWESPPAQPQDIEVLMSIEHNQRPAVFGTAAPPSGLSGMLRRLAFKASESRWTHWLLLMGADRINVVEGVLDDFVRGRVPNLWKELGFGAAWKYDRPAFMRRTVTTVAVTGTAIAVVYLLLRARDS
jgi:hypothetical protein